MRCIQYDGNLREKRKWRKEKEIESSQNYDFLIKFGKCIGDKKAENFHQIIDKEFNLIFSICIHHPLVSQLKNDINAVYRVLPFELSHRKIHVISVIALTEDISDLNVT